MNLTDSTKFVHLKKPSPTERYNIDIFNNNSEIIDQQFEHCKELNEQLTEQINCHADNETVHISPTERNTWNNKIGSDDIADWAKQPTKPSYTKAEIGLENVDNTSDMDKPVSAAQQAALDEKQNVQEGKGLSSNDFTDEEKSKLDGIEDGANHYVHPAIHSAEMIEQDAQHRFVSDIEKTAWNGAYEQSTGYTDQKIADLINGAPSTLDTLGEIAAAMQDNADVVTALNNAIGTKAPQAELDTHTGNDTVHVTSAEKDTWNAKLGADDVMSIFQGKVSSEINESNEEFLMYGVTYDEEGNETDYVPYRIDTTDYLKRIFDYSGTSILHYTLHSDFPATQVFKQHGAYNLNPSNIKNDLNGIARGDFSKVPIGSSWNFKNVEFKGTNIGNITLRVVDADYFYPTLNKHHIIVMPDTVWYSQSIGYTVNEGLFNTNYNLFYNDDVYFSDLLHDLGFTFEATPGMFWPSSVIQGAGPSGYACSDMYAGIPTTTMMFGTCPYPSVYAQNNSTTGFTQWLQPADTQFSYFRYYPQEARKINYTLNDFTYNTTSSILYMIRYYNGHLQPKPTAYSQDIRPYFIITGAY